jgi:trk system potassium uptake protein TrkA
MYVIVVGCGKVGAKFACDISADGHDVVIIDNNMASFKLLDDDFRGLTIEGVPIDVDILVKSGIENADAFVAMTPNDNINIMACQIAQEIYNVPTVLARIFDPTREHVFHDFGLQTICPTNLTVETIKSMIIDKSKIQQITLGNESITFSQLDMDDSMINKKLKDVIVEESDNIFGIIRQGTLIYYSNDIVIKQDDKIVLAKKI